MTNTPPEYLVGRKVGHVRFCVFGEKGLVEVAGSLAVTVLDAVGANAVVEAVKALRPKPGSRKVKVTLKEGESTREFFLDGDGLSERQFVKSVDAALAVFARREG